MATILLVLLGFLPGFAWLVFFLREDMRHPEPRRLLLYTFISGGAVTFLALALQSIVNRWITANGIQPYSFPSFLVLTAIEEIVKFFAAWWIIRGRKEFDEPIDAMIYMIVAALGFATVENVAQVFKSQEAFYPLPGAVEIATLRFVGATLLHAFSSGIIGYYWGRSLALGKGLGRLVIGGAVLAILLHAIFNYLIIKSETIIIPVAFLIAVGGIVFGDFEKIKRYN